MGKKILFLIIAIAIFSFLGLYLLSSLTYAVNCTDCSNVCPGGDGVFDSNGWIKFEEEDSGQSSDLISYTAASDKIVTAVCVKGGSEGSNDGGYKFFFYEDGWKQNNGENCIKVEGIGTNYAKAMRNTNLQGSICSDISHASFKVEDKPEDPAPAWEIDKAAVLNPQCIEENGDYFAQAIYTITIRNTGDATGYIEEVVDNPDEDIPASNITNISDSGYKDSGEIIWDFGEGKEVLSGGSFDLTYTVTVPEHSFGYFTNIVLAYPAESSAIQDSLEFDIGCKVDRWPEWDFDKAVSGVCVDIEGEIYAKGQYTITVENIGNGTGHLTKIVDELDEKVSESYIYDISDGGTYDEGKITWYLNENGEFHPSEKKTYTYYILIPEDGYGLYENTAKAYARVPSDNCVDTISTVECIPPETVVAMDTVEIDLNCEIEEPTYCEVVEEIYGEWSEWKVDPEDDTREYRERTITEVDAEDNTYFCGEEVEIEYRDIEDEGDVLGEDDVRDTGEVLGTSIVYAQTAGGDRNYLIHLIQYFLTILTGFSFIYLGKKKFEI